MNRQRGYAQEGQLMRRKRNVERCRRPRFRGGLVFTAHRLRVSLTSRLESNKEEEGLD